MGAIDRGAGKNIDEFREKEEIFGASASAALYCRKALEKVKLPRDNFFDSDYFAYFEDVDLAWRMRLAGFSSFYCPDAKVLHIHGASAKKFSTFQKFHIHRNHYYNIIKDLPLKFAFRALFLMLGRYFILAKGVFLKKGSGSELIKNEGGGSVIKIVPKVWWQVIINLPSLFRKRRIVQKKLAVSNSEIKSWFNKFGVDIKKSVYGD
jgi:GT2 family glycosyltransferase